MMIMTTRTIITASRTTKATRTTQPASRTTPPASRTTLPATRTTLPATRTTRGTTGTRRSITTDWTILILYFYGLKIFSTQIRRIAAGAGVKVVFTFNISNIHCTGLPTKDDNSETNVQNYINYINFLSLNNPFKD